MSTCRTGCVTRAISSSGNDNVTVVTSPSDAIRNSPPSFAARVVADRQLHIPFLRKAALTAAFQIVQQPVTVGEELDLPQIYALPTIGNHNPQPILYNGYTEENLPARLRAPEGIGQHDIQHHAQRTARRGEEHTFPTSVR